MGDHVQKELSLSSFSFHPSKMDENTFKFLHFNFIVIVGFQTQSARVQKPNVSLSNVLMPSAEATEFYLSHTTEIRSVEQIVHNSI